MVEGDQDAHQVHQDPQEVQDVVPIGALHNNFFEDEAEEIFDQSDLDKWTGGLPGSVVDICCHCPGEEGWTKV